MEQVSSMRIAELHDLAEELGLDSTGMRKNEVKGLILDHLADIVPF